MRSIGEDGVRHFQHQSFDLVLCDVFMPHKEGLATMREIRQLSAATPIISMTGSIPHRRQRINPDFPLTNGAARTIAKPFRPRDLLALVRECLVRSSKSSGGVTRPPAYAK